MSKDYANSLIWFCGDFEPHDDLLNILIDSVCDYLSYHYGYIGHSINSDIVS